MNKQFNKQKSSGSRKYLQESLEKRLITPAGHFGSIFSSTVLAITFLFFSMRRCCCLY
jgi:hypothetical protein